MVVLLCKVYFFQQWFWYLLQENKSIIRRRLAYIKGSAQDLSQFAVLVRGIPWSAEESYSTTLKNYFTKYYPSSYLSHQMVYHCGKMEKLMVCIPPQELWFSMLTYYQYYLVVEFFFLILHASFVGSQCLNAAAWFMCIRGYIFCMKF